MSLFLYNLSVSLYTLAIRLSAPFLKKARSWIEGRRNWRKKLEAGFEKKGPVLWMHVASLGEFEQGRPLIESFRREHPDWQIVLSFFSPSGYLVRKNYRNADLVCYLPPDSQTNAKDFLNIIRPDFAVFVKYEFWYHYLDTLRNRNIPTILISAVFRKRQPFFRKHGNKVWRSMLNCFNHIFVQNDHSAKLLRHINVRQVSIAGDTRVDRVLDNALHAPDNPVLAAFRDSAGKGLLVAGSTWEADEAVFLPVLLDDEYARYKIVIAPHDPGEYHIKRLFKYLKVLDPQDQFPCIRYSEATPDNVQKAHILVIDNVGMLSTLYRYGEIAFIGGGFGKGIHNILEPASFGLPVLFGPRHHKFDEAKSLIRIGGAFEVRDTSAFAAVMRHLENPKNGSAAKENIFAYLEQNKGATQKIMDFWRNTQNIEEHASASLHHETRKTPEPPTSSV